MKLPPVDLNWFTESLTETAQIIVGAWTEAGTVAVSDESTPELLENTLEQLNAVLRQSEWNRTVAGNRGSPEEIGVTELGDYGLNLLAELTQVALELGLDQETERLEQLALSLALWVIRQDGELESIELVVNGLARLANQTMELHELERVFFVMSEILDALSPQLLQKRGEVPAHQPWQLLLLNRAIVATRSLSPPLMEIAFADVAERLPEQAPSFFREGMDQVKIQDYPAPVQEVIERYHQDWPMTRILH